MEESQTKEKGNDISNKEVISSLKKKNWGSYFKEFLMLFLAVFCGFLAENYREKQVEIQQEKQFVQSYIEDLKSDTAAIRIVLEFRRMKMMQMDSLMQILATQSIKGNENDLYFLGRTLVRTVWFQSNDRTISQLKNSGSLRLIRNEQATDSIMSYQKLIERLETSHEDDRTERYNLFPIISKLFNPFVFEEMVTVDGIQRPVNNPPLRSYDPALQQDLAFWINQLKGSTFIIEVRLEELHEKAVDLINLLSKEYNIE